MVSCHNLENIGAIGVNDTTVKEIDAIDRLVNSEEKKNKEKFIAHTHKLQVLTVDRFINQPLEFNESVYTGIYKMSHIGDSAFAACDLCVSPTNQEKA